MNRSLQSVSQLNELGVSLLMDNKYAQACEAFRSTLLEMQRLTSEWQQPALPPAAMLSVNNELQLRTREVPELQGHNFYVYNKALHFTIAENSATPVLQLPSVSAEDMSFYTAIIVYNTGLAHHGLGRRTGEDAILLKSVQFYQHALELIDGIALDSDQSRQMMASILNNQTQIYMERRDYEKARQQFELFQLIRRHLMLSRDCSNIIDRHDLEGFTLNIFMLKVRPAAAVA